MSQLIDKRSAWRWALAAWTLIIWGSRIRNALGDDDLSGGGRSIAVLIAAGFVLLAAVLIVTLVQRARADLHKDQRSTRAAHRIVIDVLVMAGILRWTIRAPLVLLSDEWTTGFKLVHTVLWLVTVSLSALAWRESRQEP